MSRGTCVAGAIAVLLAACAALAGEALVAEEITARNVADLRIGGPDAIGGIGDWFLANDVIEVIVDAPSRRHAKLNHGGTIVDVGLRDREDEDQFARLIPLLNLSQRVLVNYDSIRAERDSEAGIARLFVTSPGLSTIERGSRLSRRFDPMVPASEDVAGVRVETVYEVRLGEPFVHITTTLTNDGTREAPVFAWGDLWMRGGRSIRSFVGNADAPERSRGFHHLSFSRTNLLRSADAMAAFTHVSAAGLPAWPPIAYALFSPERAARGLPFFGVTGEHVSLAVAFIADPPWSSFGMLRFVSALADGLAPGQTWTHRRRLLVTGRADTAATTDVIFPLLGTADPATGLEGRVEPVGLRCSIQVDTAAGRPVTQVVAATEGAEAGGFRTVLPAGDYRLTFRAPHRPARTRDVAVAAGRFARVPTERFEEPGWLVFERAFADGGPGRVVVRGEDGTPNPVFGAELLDFRIDGELGPSGSETDSLYFLGNRHDPSAVPVPPGRYRLVAARGLEHDAAVQRVEVPGPGVRVPVAPFEITRVSELPDWVSADLHVHAEASDDSGTTNEARLRHFVAEDIDVLVATDHDHVADYGPALADLDVGHRIRVVTGVEVTSSTPSPRAPFTIGHHNAWPMTHRLDAHRQGAPPSQNVGVAELYASLRRDFGAEVVQLNHARGTEPGVSEGSYFSHLRVAGTGFDRRLPLDAWPNRVLLEATPDGTRAIDFDVMEVMNGSSWSRFRELREDWYALLRQGIRRTATANSDTHGPDELAGYPRNYVRVGAAASRFERLDAALVAGRSFGTTGPLIVHFAVNGGRSGDVVGAPGGRVIVEFDVDAAPWVPVDEVRLLVNGDVVRVFERQSGFAELTLDRDAFVTLEAGAPLETSPRRWRATHPGLYADDLAPGHLPVAFSNPVWIDADGDGELSPPGLPPPPPVWRRRPVTTLGLVGVALVAVLWLASKRRC